MYYFTHTKRLTVELKPKTLPRHLKLDMFGDCHSLISCSVLLVQGHRLHLLLNPTWPITARALIETAVSPHYTSNLPLVISYFIAVSGFFFTAYNVLEGYHTCLWGTTLLPSVTEIIYHVVKSNLNFVMCCFSFSQALSFFQYLPSII